MNFTPEFCFSYISRFFLGDLVSLCEYGILYEWVQKWKHWTNGRCFGFQSFVNWFFVAGVRIKAPLINVLQKHNRYSCKCRKNGQIVRKKEKITYATTAAHAHNFYALVNTYFNVAEHIFRLFIPYFTALKIRFRILHLCAASMLRNVVCMHEQEDGRWN